MSLKIKVISLIIGILGICGIALSQTPNYYVDEDGIVHSSGYQFLTPLAANSCLQTDATGLIIEGTGLSCGGTVSLPLNQIGYGTGSSITSSSSFTYNGTSLSVNTSGPHVFGGSNVSSVQWLLTGSWANEFGLAVNTALSGTQSDMHIGHFGGSVTQTANTAYGTLTNLFVEKLTVNTASGATVANLASFFINGPPVGMPGWSLLTRTGGSSFSEYPFFIGSADITIRDIGFFVTGSFTAVSVGGAVYFHAENGSVTGDTSTTFANGLNISDTYITASSGTSEWDLVFVSSQPITVNGTAVVNMASSFTIQGPPSGATKNLSGWVKTGIFEFDDDVQILKKSSPTDVAPGSSLMKFEVVAGTNSGTCKLIAYAGSSTTPTTVVDNVGAGC